MPISQTIDYGSKDKDIIAEKQVFLKKMFFAYNKEKKVYYLIACLFVSNPSGNLK
jgi:hypothetical protein